MTQSGLWFINALPGFFQGMNQRFAPAFNALQEEIGGLEGQDVGFVQIGLVSDEISPKSLAVYNPYSNPETVATQLAGAAERGWLDSIGDGIYTLSPQGQECGQRIVALVKREMAAFAPLPVAQLERTADLLRRVMDTAVAAPDPPGSTSIARSRRFDFGPDSSLLERIRRYIGDINAFRDDAHLAAWRPHGVSGAAWEAFSFIWQGNAGTAAELVEKLPFRGHDTASYTAALQSLVARGWVEETGGNYAVTETGKALRQETEDLTNQYFDIAWAGLSDDEAEELEGLMAELIAALPSPSE